MKFNPEIPVYGDVSYRGVCKSEIVEQVTFFNVLRRDYPDMAKIALHPRNEGKRSYQQTSRHKAEGMAPGASDIIIPGSPAFVCELKRQDHTKSKWQDNQEDFLITAKGYGAFVCVALGYKAALEALEKWLELQTM